MIKKYLVVGIILLFVVSSFCPMISGVNTMSKDDDFSVFLDDLIFYAGSDSPYLNDSIILDKYRQYIECFDDYVSSADYVDVEDNFLENPDSKVEQRSSLIGSYGPMDSPWPMFCHDNNKTGRSQYNTSRNPMVEKWRYRFKGSIWAMHPSIDNEGTIYIPGIDLYAINPDGTMKWTYDLQPGWHEFMCPAIDENGTLYLATFSSLDKHFYAINKNGSLKWAVNEGQLYAPPIIGEDGIIYYTRDHSIVARYKNNGSLKWENSIAGDIMYSSPTIGIDGTIYFGSIDNYIYAVYPNGTLRWKFDTGHWVHGSATIAEDGIVYIGSDNQLYAFYPNNGTVKWQLGSGGIWGAPALDKDGILYVGDWDMRFSAIYPNGTIKWTYDAPGIFWFSCPAISEDGTIYTGTMKYNEGDDSFLAFNPDGSLKWMVEYGVCESSPVIGKDGTVYFISEHGGEDPYCLLHAFGRGPLLVNAGGPYSGYTGNEIQFTGTIFGGIPPYTYHWDFGDGNTSDKQNPTYIYSDMGEYTAIFSVIDSEGNYSSDNTSVTITYPPPTVSIIKPKNALYFMNLMIRPFLLDRRPLIFGLINVKASATNDYVDIDRVEFYINNELVKTDEIWPYAYLWQGSGSFEEIQEIKAIAYDVEGESASDLIEVRKIF